MSEHMAERCNQLAPIKFQGGMNAYCTLPRGHEGAHLNGRTEWSVSAPDVVNHPPHYTNDPSGVECITITRHRNFNIGNAIKYLWRAGRKDDPELQGNSKQIQDLEKAVWYINDEIQRLKDTRP